MLLALFAMAFLLAFGSNAVSRLVTWPLLTGEQRPFLLGFEIETLIAFASAVLALLLFAISATAYVRERTNRLLFVMLGFLLFLLKGTMIVLDEFFYFGGVPIESLAQLLDFGILALFFLGLVKK